MLGYSLPSPFVLEQAGLDGAREICSLSCRHGWRILYLSEFGGKWGSWHDLHGHRPRDVESSEVSTSG